MHERFNDHRGPHVSEHVFMAGSAADLAALCGPGSETSPRAAAWNALPTGRTEDSITALRLLDRQSSQHMLPPKLSELQRLAYLSVPAHLVPQLETGFIPPSVRTLVIETAQPTAIPRGVILPHVLRLVAPAPLTFLEETFPHLEHLSTRLEPRQRMLPVISRMRNLRSVGIGPISSPDAFSVLAELPDLGLLGFSGGNLAALDGIARLETLTNLNIANLNKLSNLQALAALERLEELSFFYCPRLEGLEVLLQIKRLRGLEFVGCSDKTGAIAAVRARLEAHGLGELRFA